MIPALNGFRRRIGEFAIALCAVLTVSLSAAGNARALVKFDFERKFFQDPPQPVLDHCVVEEGGVYHLFYLRGNPAQSIGHATTTDFVHWTLKPPVLSLGTWDDRALWAPFLYPNGNGTWYMYYTGVNLAWAQQTGIALSNDLNNWFKIPWPVYHPDPSWALWAEDDWSHGRDPHVIEYNGKWYLFLTAKTTWDRGAVACAESSDLINWTDIGPIYVHDSWHVLESVFILQRNGKFHMFFTEEEVFGTSHMVSDSLVSGWDISTRSKIDNGHAPQITPLIGGAEMFSRHDVYNDYHGTLTYTLRFDTLLWFGDTPAVHKPWELANNWTLVSGNAFAYQPVFGNNPYVRGEDVAPTFEGKMWIGTKERYTGPLGFGTVGGIQGDDRTGTIRSKTFTITGRSMNLLVGGTNDLGLVYVALVDATTGQVLCKETGKDVEEMDRRYWDLSPYRSKQAYIEITDNSTVGHINCDDITESYTVLDDESQTTGKDGKTTRGLVDGADPAPGRLVLHQNTPNPFNPSTVLSYEIPRAGRVKLDVYDVSGTRIKGLVDRVEQPGEYRVPWNGVDRAGKPVVSGVYFYRLSFDGEVVQTRKMLLLK